MKGGRCFRNPSSNWIPFNLDFFPFLWPSILLSQIKEQVRTQVHTRPSFTPERGSTSTHYPCLASQRRPKTHTYINQRRFTATSVQHPSRRIKKLNQGRKETWLHRLHVMNLPGNEISPQNITRILQGSPASYFSFLPSFYFSFTTTTAAPPLSPSRFPSGPSTFLAVSRRSRGGKNNKYPIMTPLHG